MTENKISKFIEEFILVVLILTKVLEFFGLTKYLGAIGIYPGELEIIDIVISMTALAYVLYSASVSDIFFGKRHPHLDAFIILCCFLLIANKFVSFSESYIEHYNEYYKEKYPDRNPDERYQLVLNETFYSEHKDKELDAFVSTWELTPISGIPYDKCFEDKDKFGACLACQQIGICMRKDTAPGYGDDAIFFDVADLIKSNNISFEAINFILGNLLIILISLYIAFKVEIVNPSIVQAMLGENNTNPSKISKFIMSIIVITSFYLTFFNFVMEWLTVVIDAPVILIVIFLYIFKIHDIGKSMDSEVLLHKIADAVEEFVEEFIKLFHSRKTIFLGIAGILVLHLISDTAAFIIPYALPTESIYSESPESHQKLFDLFEQDRLKTDDTLSRSFLVFGYIFNTVAIIYLMLFPVYVWYIIYLKRTEEEPPEGIEFPSLLISLFFASLVYVLFLPAYKITRFPGTTGLLGVDIQTQSLLQFGNALFLFSAASLLVFLLITIISISDRVKKILFFSMTIISIFFFGIYVYNFLSSVVSFYTLFIPKLINSHDAIRAVYYIFYLFISVVFYIGGYIDYLVSVFR